MKKIILEKIYNQKRNNIITGEISTGKTTNIGYGIVKKIIDKEENIFILDTREEYLKKYYQILKEKNYNIKIINLKNPTKSEGWNILEYPYKLYKKGNKDSSVTHLENIAKEIFYTDNNSNEDPFWMNSASDYFIGITLAMFEDAKKEEINLKSIGSLIDDSNSEIIAEYFRTKEKNDISYICASGTVFSPKETRGGIISSTKQKLRNIISREELNHLLNKTTFNYENFLNNKNAIFLINSENNDSLNPISSIFIEELYNILIENNNTNNFHFILDNFDILNKIPNLKNMLSSSIYNKIKFYIFTRDKEKLEKEYSNYINKLTNIITLTEKEISIKLNNDIQTIPNQIIKADIKNININYPNLKIEEIKEFNLKKFILENIKINEEN